MLTQFRMQRRDDTYSSIISMTSSYSNSYKARTRPRSPPTKRKITCMDNGNASDAIARRKKRVKTSKQDSRRSFDTDKNIDSALGSLDSQLLADYLVQKVRQYEPDLSLVEIEEKRIPGHDTLSLSFRIGTCVRLTCPSECSLQHD